MAAQGLAQIAGGREDAIRDMYADYNEVNAVRMNAPRLEDDAPDPYAGADPELRPTVTGAALGQIIANRATFQTDSIEPPAMHPEVAEAQRAREWLEENEGFVTPDALGRVECVVCKYGVFNESTQNTAMGHFQAMYTEFCDRMHEAQMFTYMTRFWNDRLRMEYTHVPVVSVSAVRFHFKQCMRKQNMVQRLQENLAVTERAIGVLEQTALYVEHTGGDDSDDERRLPRGDRDVLEGLSGRLDALHRYMQRAEGSGGGDGADGNGSTAVARRGLGAETEERICVMVGEMSSHVAGLYRRRRRRRRRVALSEEGVAMLTKLNASVAQTSKAMLEWRKYEDAAEVTKRGLPAYCSRRKATSESMVDIYSNRRVQGGQGPSTSSAAAYAPGDMSDRFSAY